MADRNQLKKSEHPEFTDEDPFAELTRIMGFDPRVPVRPAAPVEAANADVANSDVRGEDDFAIDLEKELMGEFDSLEDETAEPAAFEAGDFTLDEPAAAPGAQVFGVPKDEPPTEDFDFAFDDELMPDEPAAVTLEPVDTALADELDAAFADDLVLDDIDTGEEPQAFVEPEAVAEEEEALTGAFDTVFADDRTAGELEAASADVEEEPLPEELVDTFATAFDDDLSADEDLSAAGDLLAEDDSAPLYDADPEPEADAVVPLIPIGAARHFEVADDAMASVDMDFGAEIADELAQSLDAEDIGAADPEELSLEEELNALLGNGAPVAAAAEPETDEVFDEAVEPIIPLAAELPQTDAADAQAFAPELAEPEFAAPEFVDEERHALPVEATAYDEVAAQPDQFEPEAFEQHEPQYYESEQAHEAGPAYAYADAEPVAIVEEADEAREAEPESVIDDATLEAIFEDELVVGAPYQDEPVAEAPAYEEPLAAIAEDDEPVAAEALDDEPAEAHPASSFAPAEPLAAKAPAVEEEEDPFEMLAAMVRDTHPVTLPSPVVPAASGSFQDFSRSIAPTATESVTVPTTGYQYQNHAYTNRAPISVPDIDTVDVPEAAVAFADDLDIPELDYEADLPAAADLDDFEAELANAFSQTNDIPAAQPARAVSRDDFHSGYRPSYRQEPAQQQDPVERYEPAAPAGEYLSAAAPVAAATAATIAATPAFADEQHPDELYGSAEHDGDLAAGQARGAHYAEDDGLDFDPDLNEEMAATPVYAEAMEPQPRRGRGLLIAGIIAGVAVIGGIGAYALSFGGGSGPDAPAVVRADEDPVKVRPENPGGTVVPNQDNQVFQTMKGTSTADAPTQEKLISGTEEPVDMAARTAEPRIVTPQAPVNEEMPVDDEFASTEDGDPVAAEIAAAPKGEDRVQPEAAAETAGQNAESVAVAPRRVRTMVVRADGTLVPREEPAPAQSAQPEAVQPEAGAEAAALEPANPSGDLTDPAVAPEETASLQPTGSTPSNAAPAAAASAEQPAAAKPAAPKPAAPARASNMPASGPVAPSRPADQPVDVVGEVKPQQVAAAGGAAAAAGTWSMQIASQPSQAAAQSSYEDLARRYGNVIGGRGVNIVKAEIAGKGTYWRVRVPAGSRNEAVSLCESYKSAGGNCFVSR